MVRERQVRVVPRHEPVLHHALQLLDEVWAHIAIRQLLDDFRQQAAGQVGVGLYLRRYDWDVAEGEPPEGIVEAYSAAVRHVKGVGKQAVRTPVRRQRHVLESTHEPGNIYVGLGRRRGSQRCNVGGTKPQHQHLALAIRAQSVCKTVTGTTRRQSVVVDGDALLFQFRRQRPGGRAATVAAAVNLVYQDWSVLLLQCHDLPGDQVRLQQHSLGEIKRVEVVARFDWHFDVRKQARDFIALAELVHGRPVAAAEAGEHGEDRLLAQMPLELFPPGG